MAFIPCLIIAVVYAIGFADAAHHYCHVCDNVCGYYDDPNELDRQCNYDQGGSENCQNGCFTEITCNPDGSGEICITKRCTVPNNVCVRSREFYPVVWAGPEDVSTCSVSECCKRDYCNEYSGRDLDATLRACCPDCKKCPVEVIFVLDVSGSVRPFLTAIANFVTDIISQFDPFLVPVGVVCFSSQVDTIFHLGEVPNVYIEALLLLFIEGLDNLNHDGATDISAGIDGMVGEFLDHSLNEPYTDRLGVVITDGYDGRDLAASITDAFMAVSDLSLVSVKTSDDVNEVTLKEISSTIYDLTQQQEIVDKVDGLLSCH